MRTPTDYGPCACWSLGFGDGRAHASQRLRFDIGEKEDLSENGWAEFIKGYVAGYEVGTAGL